jgi:hypothetical protein
VCTHHIPSDDENVSGSPTAQQKGRQTYTAIPPQANQGMIPLATGLSGISPLDTTDLVATITSQVVAQLRAENVAPGIPAKEKRVTHIAQDPSDSEEELTTCNMITGAINGLIADESLDTDPARDSNEFQSVSLPLGSTIPSKLKSKIWADEYIDLRALTKDADDEEFTFTVRKTQGSPSIAMTPTGQKAIPLDNIEEWTSVMLTFGAIYTERHPKSAPAMFKYIKNRARHVNTRW